MPLDTNLLYGEMAGSWLVHLAIPVGVSVLISSLPFMELSRRVLLLLVITVAISFAAQWLFMISLQASSCNGVKDYSTTFKGAFIAAIITAIMTAVPLYFESIRLSVSQLFGEHKSLLTAEEAKQSHIIQEAATRMIDAQKGGGLSVEEYDNQVFKESMIGASYWSAFAGAYGIALGSLVAAPCPAIQ